VSKSISKKVEDSKKFFEKNAQANLNTKAALSALASLEKATAELTALKAKVSELTAARKETIFILDAEMARVRMEKKLKAKEAKLQARLVALSSPVPSSK
jgi:hypothetical protein